MNSSAPPSNGTSRTGKTPDTLVLDDSKSQEEIRQKLVETLEVDEIDTDLYRSRDVWLPKGARGAFGGQLIAQALRSACYTVADGFRANSLHTYFVLAATADVPVLYHVERVRDGRSFATRLVHAKQRGKTVVVVMVSFAKSDANAITLEQQTPMPKVPLPHELPSDAERIAVLSKDERLPLELREMLETIMDVLEPMEFRDLDIDTAEDYISGTKPPSEEGGRWFKTTSKINDDPHLHACVIAYASDSGLLTAACRANGITPGRQISMMTSLDHSIRFHSHAQTDEWLLHYMQCLQTGDGRTTCSGRIYTMNGKLVATTSQEGVVRLSKSAQEYRRNQKLKATGTSSPSQQAPPKHKL